MPVNLGRSTSLRWNETTTPKNPTPEPLAAQNSSLCRPSEARTRLPSARTTSIAITFSHPSPTEQQEMRQPSRSASRTAAITSSMAAALTKQSGRRSGSTALKLVARTCSSKPGSPLRSSRCVLSP